MAIIIKFKEGRKEIWHQFELKDLSEDIKQVLEIQCNEFITRIESSEDEAASVGSVSIVQFLYDCYSAA